MIVVDENAAGETLLNLIRGWYRGKVCGIRDLLPGAVIKDEMIPRLLAAELQPTFVTFNVSDFWQEIKPHSKFCIVCLPIPPDRPEEFSEVLRRVLGLRPFSTKRSRMGKVALAGQDGVRYYSSGAMEVVQIPWS